MSKDFRNALKDEFPEFTISSEDAKMIYDQAECFFNYKKKVKPQTQQKKKSPSPVERQGIYDEDKCDARIWIEKKNSGGLGLDNIQCSSKKVDGCLCKKHKKMQEEGGLWIGLITDPRPEEPIHPTYGPKMWCTDKEGNDVVKKKEKKEKKEKKKKSSEKKAFTGYTYFGQEKKDEITQFAEQNKIKWMCQMANMWGSLSSEEKDSWNDLALHESLEQKRKIKRAAAADLSIREIEDLIAQKKLQHWKDLESARRNEC